MAEPNIESLILVTTAIFFMALFFIVLYIFIYYSRKKKYIEEKRNLEAAFEQELLKTQLEVQEQTLANVSRELHDNISQVLSFVKLNLALTGNASQHEKQFKIDESRELVAQAITDLRNLSKSLSYEHIANLGLVKALNIEATRLNNSGLIKVVLDVQGNEFSLGEQLDLILFRIFQEALNNTLKYADAQHFKICLQYSNQLVNLILEDDGRGFSLNEVESNEGLGLRNMKSRTALIGAELNIESSPGNGCRIVIKLNHLTQFKYPDENDSNSAR